MIRHRALLAGFAALLLGAATARAQAEQVFTWTDADGTAHFANRAEDVPKGVKATRMTVDAAPVASPSPARPRADAGEYRVRPYLVYPSDQRRPPEYAEAVRKYLAQLQRWYFDQVGATFAMAPLEVVTAPEPYLTIRCGATPTEECVHDRSRVDGNLPMYMNRAIHGGEERWDERTATLVFAAGAGGWAGANLYPNDTGWAVVGDWVLEPLSGVPSPWGIPCALSSGWQCAGRVPEGTPAHELGHAFGLPHPAEGKSIMRWHGDYGTAGFLPEEIEHLRQSPFFRVHERP